MRICLTETGSAPCRPSPPRGIRIDEPRRNEEEQHERERSKTRHHDERQPGSERAETVEKHAIPARIPGSRPREKPRRTGGEARPHVLVGFVAPQLSCIARLTREAQRECGSGGRKERRRQAHQHLDCVQRHIGRCGEAHARSCRHEENRRCEERAFPSRGIGQGAREGGRNERGESGERHRPTDALGRPAHRLQMYAEERPEAVLYVGAGPEEEPKEQECPAALGAQRSFQRRAE